MKTTPPSQHISLFHGKEMRKTWHNEQWYFSVIDIISVLTEQPDFKKAKSYWTTLKGRLKKEGSELVTKCDQLKMLIFTALAELSTRQIAESMQTKGFEKNKLPAKKGGQIAKDARRDLETKTGKSVISRDNFLPPTSRKQRKHLS